MLVELLKQVLIVATVVTIKDLLVQPLVILTLLLVINRVLGRREIPVSIGAPAGRAWMAGAVSFAAIPIPHTP
jgi:hypothetical protein